MNKLSYPPGPKHPLLDGTLVGLLRSAPEALADLADRYGDLVRLGFGPRQFFLLNHPDYIHKVLVSHSASFVKGPALQRSRLILGENLLTSEGAYHLQNRRLVQPAFYRPRLETYTAYMAAYAHQLSRSWKSGQIIDLHPVFTRLTMRVAVRALFDLDLDDRSAEQVGSAVADLLGASRLAVMPFADRLQNLPFGVTVRINTARRDLENVVDGLISERQNRGLSDDALSVLLANSNLSQDQVRNEALTLLLAGHETTANALTWAFYLLAAHTVSQSQLQAEYDQILAGQLPEYTYLKNLTATRMAVLETLRLFPPAWTIGRQAVEPVEIGGYTLPAGSSVLLSQWVMHRDSRYYPDPSTFQLQRWLPEVQTLRPRFAYFPFGGGERICIGEQFAQAELAVVMAVLLQDWSIRPAWQSEIKCKAQITLRPDRPVMVEVEKRTKGQL